MEKLSNQLMVVTGGAGFIGSHLSEKLIEMGCRVRVIDNLSQGKREWVPEEAEFFEGDILEKNLLRKVSNRPNLSKYLPSRDHLQQHSLCILYLYLLQKHFSA